jgi:hypothetical protein
MDEDMFCECFFTFFNLDVSQTGYPKIANSIGGYGKMTIEHRILEITSFFINS